MRALTTPRAIAALAFLVAIAILWPALDVGVWTHHELDVFDRTRAELGVALSGLERSPWLPDALRTFSYEANPTEVGLRFPHALAAAGLVAFAAGLARARGGSPTTAVVAGALALAFPVTIHGGTTALGNPVGELLGVAAIAAGLTAVSEHGARRLGWSALAALALAGAVASAGLLLGGVLVVAVWAAMLPSETPSRMRMLAWAAAAAGLFVVLWLSLKQGDGYIPLLGDAKDLDVVDKPQTRRFTAGLQEAGYQLFPWTPLVLIGALAATRDRGPSLWLAIAVTLAAGWSILYGPAAFPLTVPAALCGAAAVERLDAPGHAGPWRRVVVLGALLGIVVLGKDASLTPSQIAAPLAPFDGEHMFPADGSHAPARLSQIAKLAALSVLLVGVLSVPTDSRLGRLWARLGLARHRAALFAVLIGGAALYGAGSQTLKLMPDLSAQLSPKRPMTRWAQWAAEGRVPPKLAIYRIRDAGLDLYGPEDAVNLRSRREAGEWLTAEDPSVLMVRRRDWPALYQQMRTLGREAYVLDDSHQLLLLIANFLPEGVEDQNDIPGVLFNEPPRLANETYVKFGNYVEVIGWEITEPVVRGREVTVRFVLKTLRPLPSGSKMYARLLKGRSSRMNGEPTALTGDIYPANLWRPGDYILHEVTFTAPWLEIQWGPHEVLIGLRRTERHNIEISVPEDEVGDFGVKVRGKKRYFAEIGVVEVW